MKQGTIDSVKIRIRTHDPFTLDEQEFSNLDDALDYLSLVRSEYKVDEEAHLKIGIINGTLYKTNW